MFLEAGHVVMCGDLRGKGSVQLCIGWLYYCGIYCYCSISTAYFLRQHFIRIVNKCYALLIFIRSHSLPRFVSVSGANYPLLSTDIIVLLPLLISRLENAKSYN